jgi:antitoxin PrlF
MAQKQATITSKGQVTIPREVRRMLGVETGDKLIFENDESGIRVRAIRSPSNFSKYRGIGNPAIESGRESINGWLRELRGDMDGE